MKKYHNLIKAFTGLLMACMFLFPVTITKIQAAEYEIVFKAGAHGTVNGQKEVSYRLSTNDVFPDEPVVTAQEGYVFKGWNKELPDVGSKVSGKTVYVAKYGVVINGVTYTVRYVDENKTDIATPKTMLGEQGSSITERAKTVAGYMYQQSEQTFTLTNEMEIQFVYTLTNPNEVIRYETITEEEIINQVQNQQNANNPTTNNTPVVTPNPTPDQEIDIPDNPQPNGDGENGTQGEEDEVDIPDNEQPQSNGRGPNYATIASIGGLAILLGGLVFFYFIKKNKEQAAEE